jgi:ABC-type Zn2+ transport system substrate-binding protein/surface adhesin
MSFRIKKIPKNERDMEEIVREIQSREAEEAHEPHEHQHEHEHVHQNMSEISTGISAELIDAMIHVMEHQLGELAQINEKTNRMSRSIDDLVQSIEDLKMLIRNLIKIQLANIIEDKEIKKKLIEDVINNL